MSTLNHAQDFVGASSTCRDCQLVAELIDKHPDERVADAVARALRGEHDAQAPEMSSDRDEAAEIALNKDTERDNMRRPGWTPQPAALSSPLNQSIFIRRPWPARPPGPHQQFGRDGIAAKIMAALRRTVSA